MKKALILMASIALATSSAHAVTAVTPTGGGITASDRSPFLNALGGTTAGKALFQMANPGAVRYLRINADNTVSALDAAAFLADIGGTGGGGATTWGSISGTLSAQTDLNSVLNGKQETLVSGTNIKTVNGSSLLGSGNIVIAGGGGTWGAITGTLSAQTDLNSALGLKAPLASPTFTGTVTAATIAATTTNATALSIGGTAITATGEELNYTSGVTSAIQTQLAAKAPNAGTQTGVHATPSTTTPLSPTWTGPMHTVWYGVTGTINLPAAAGYTGRGIMVYNTGAFTVTVDPNASEVVVRDGTVQTGGVSMTLSTGAGNFVALISDGARWITLGFKGTLTVGS